MGVSTGEAINPDLNALLNGGDDFLKRVAELKAAKAAHDTAFQNLKIGNDAAAALVKANEQFNKSKELLAETNATAVLIVDEAKRQAEGLIKLAQSNATELESQAKLSAARSQQESQKKLLDASNEANNLQTRAKSDAEKAETIRAQHEKDYALLVNERMAVQTATAAANQAEATFKSKLAAIQAAANSITG